MAPIRRYLRITRYSVLEVRIYLDNPALANTWLLNPRDPILPRVIEAVRPLVLPKLREENERAKTKKKSKGVKDVIAEEDFEVSIFLTDLSARHSILTKHKSFGDKPQIQSNSSRLTGWLSNTSETSIHVEDDELPTIRREETDAPIDLDAIPDVTDNPPTRTTRRKRGRDQSESTLLAQETEGSDPHPPSEKRRQKRAVIADQHTADDDKKKLALSTSYDGYSIYGRILCLVVKRKGNKSKTPGAPASGSEMLENWVSTQAAQEVHGDEDDDG
ncbi:hypothetical protein LTR66_013503 [Elasticomyces elasticus]|nr:hypothetical protein LTR66_013503 [Elasticomyces elasticus]